MDIAYYSQLKSGLNKGTFSIFICLFSFQRKPLCMYSSSCIFIFLAFISYVASAAIT